MPNEKIYDELTNFAESNSSNSRSIDARSSIAKITLICRRCNLEFYFNNKLHKHLRNCNKIISRKTQKKSSMHVMISQILVIESTNKQKNFHGFVFRTHHYVTVKEILLNKELFTLALRG